MNTVRIIVKEFTQQIRDWKSNSLMILFPIILITILGAALSSAFSGMMSLPEIKAAYTIEGAGPLQSAFRSMTVDSAVGAVKFVVMAKGREEGIQSVENADSSAYLVVGSHRIELYRNERYPVEAGIVKSIVTAFLLRFNASAAAGNSGGPAAVQPTGSVSGLPAISDSYVESRSLTGKRTPSSTDFYSVSMLTLIILYAALFGASRARTERRLGTSNRILSAPVGRTQLLVGQVVGSLMALVVQAAVLVAFSHYVLGAYWGTHFLAISALIVAESLMIISVGIAVAYLLPSEAATAAVLNTIIPVLAFFSGTYVPLDMMGSAAEKLAVYSPLKWVNQALLGVIFDGDFSAVGHALVLNFGAAVLFIAVAVIFTRREAYR